MDSRFCNYCGNRLGPPTPSASSPALTQAADPHPPSPAEPPRASIWSFPPSEPEDLATPPYWDQPYEDGRHQGADSIEVHRTKTGLMLCAIGFALAWIPLIGGLGGLLAIVGWIFLVLGREAFDDAHHRYVVGGGLLILLAAILVAFEVLAFAGAIIQSASQPGATKSAVVDALSGNLQTFLLVVAITGALGALGQVVMIYGISDTTTRWLLWLALVTGVGMTIVTYAILAPEIASAVQQSTAGPTIDLGPVVALQNRASTLGILRALPSLLFAWAYWRAREKVAEGEFDDPHALRSMPQF